MALVPWFPRSLSCLVPFCLLFLLLLLPAWPVFLPRLLTRAEQATPSLPLCPLSVQLVHMHPCAITTSMPSSCIMHPSVENSNIHRRPQHKTHQKKERKKGSIAKFANHDCPTSASAKPDGSDNLLESPACLPARRLQGVEAPILSSHPLGLPGLPPVQSVSAASQFTFQSPHNSMHHRIASHHRIVASSHHCIAYVNLPIPILILHFLLLVSTTHGQRRVDQPASLEHHRGGARTRTRTRITRTTKRQ